jgi:NADPH:quinone reductase-like Zn-dependent oxidoreductase
VNGLDDALARGRLLAEKEHEFPVVLGHDFAGVVERTGEQVTRYQEGDEVYGFVTRPKLDARSGTWADYIVVPEDRFVARKPSSLGFIESGALPLAGVTALIAVDTIDPKDGDRVLVVGATGGVGSYAVGLAAARGAHVVATATPRDEARLRTLGAAEAIDYTTDDVAGAFQDGSGGRLAGLIDVVSDAKGFGEFAALLAPGGRAVTTLGVANGAQPGVSGVEMSNIYASPDPELLTRVADAADAGGLRAWIQNVYPLEGAADALDEFAAGAHGKISLLLLNGQ